MQGVTMICSDRAEAPERGFWLHRGCPPLMVAHRAGARGRTYNDTLVTPVRRRERLACCRLRLLDAELGLPAEHPDQRPQRLAHDRVGSTRRGRPHLAWAGVPHALHDPGSGG